MTNDTYDVIQIGSGPVGLLLAAQLGRLGHKVAVVERHASIYNLPRAGHIDHEVVRSLQAVGVADKVMWDADPCSTYTLTNAAGEVLIAFPWGAQSDSGWNSDYMAYQPVMDDALYSRLADDANVEMWRGWDATAFAQDEDGVTVTLTRYGTSEGAADESNEEVVSLRGKFLIGADGASSRVREWFGIERSDKGFNETWLDIDMRRKTIIDVGFDMGNICDPARPVYTSPLGKRHRRFECSLLPGESEADMSSPAVAERLLKRVDIDINDVTIVRQQVYTFEAKEAKEWRKGRVLLAGDAAHTMPPHMGQGMCSGMRDANNVAWKLDLVLRGVADDSILDTYQQERLPHVSLWSDISIEVGKVSCTLDPVIAAARDAAFARGEKPPVNATPVLIDGILHHEADGTVSLPVGDLGPQAKIRIGEQIGLFDDLLGGGIWTLISRADSNVTLGAHEADVLNVLGGHHVPVVSRGEQGVEDYTGRYAEYLADLGWDAVLVRPDFYVYGGGTRDQIDELIQELEAQTLKRNPKPAHRDPAKAAV